jgi:hypothetical protein
MSHLILELHMVKRSKLESLSNMLEQIDFISNLICTNLNEFKLGCITEGEISTQVCLFPKNFAHQKSHEIKLASKRYTQDTLLLIFKINLKEFSFKLNSSNKSCKVRLLEYNKTGLTLFGFFYNFL